MFFFHFVFYFWPFALLFTFYMFKINQNVSRAIRSEMIP